MAMVFCRGCGKEIHETAISCPHCGAQQGVASKGKFGRPKTYDAVPWYRKNWFAIICFFFFVPGLLLALITGPIYYERGGQLKTYSVAAKVFLIIWSLVYMFGVLSHWDGWGLGDSGNQTVSLVKTGSLQSCPGSTLEEMAKSFLQDPSWDSGVSDEGVKFVNLSGEVSYADKPVHGVIQFSVDGNSFQYRALEFNGVPQSQLLAAGLLAKMCESARHSVASIDAVSSPITGESEKPSHAVKAEKRHERSASSVQDPIVGKWANATQDLTISATADGGYSGEIAVGDGEAGGCGGDITGTIVKHGQDLELIGQDQDLPSCGVKITLQGNEATTEEGEQCSTYHGASCDFTGVLKRSD